MLPSELEDIPVLDFSAFFDSEHEGRRLQLSQALVESLKLHGIAKLQNHVVHPRAIAEAFNYVPTALFFYISIEIADGILEQTLLSARRGGKVRGCPSGWAESTQRILPHWTREDLWGHRLRARRQ